MVRKALKNIPKPDEEKLQALYRPPSETTQSQPGNTQPSTQDYISTSNHNYKSTSKQLHKTTSAQDYMPTSGHVYKESSKPTSEPIRGPATPQPDIPAYQPVPPVEPIPQAPSPPDIYREIRPQRHLRYTSDLYRRQTYHLRHDQIERIRAEAFHSRQKISEVLRHIIDQYYQAERKP